MHQLITDDPMAAKVYASYRKFYDGVRAYHHISRAGLHQCQGRCDGRPGV